MLIAGGFSILGCGGGGSGGEESGGGSSAVSGDLQVVRDEGLGDDGAEAVALDSSGRILVAGYATNSSGNKDVAIWRLTSDGALDSSFGTGGIVTIAGSAGGDDLAHAIAVDSSGQILVAGETKGSSYIDAALWRLEEDGDIDSTFGSSGLKTLAGLRDDIARDLEIQSDGMIVVVGYAKYTTTDMIVWRVKSDGSALDSTFGSGGVRFYTSGYGNDYALGVALDSSGRILVAGDVSTSTGDFDMALVRLTTAGALDTTFGSGGVVTHNGAAGGSGYDYALDVAVDSSGRIVVVGGSSNGSSDDLAVWRFGSTGALDTTFGGSGYVTAGNLAGGTGAEAAEAVVLDSSGRIVVAGSSSNGTDRDIVILRFDSTGSLDSSFDSDGARVVSNVAGTGNDEAYGLAIDSSGRMVISGYGVNGSGNRDMLLLRY